MSKIDFSKEDILFIGNEQIHIDNDQFKRNGIGYEINPELAKEAIRKIKNFQQKLL